MYRVEDDPNDLPSTVAREVYYFEMKRVRRRMKKKLCLMRRLMPMKKKQLMQMKKKQLMLLCSRDLEIARYAPLYDGDS